MGDQEKTRERPTMGRIRELEAELATAKDMAKEAEDKASVLSQRLDAKRGTIENLHAEVDGLRAKYQEMNAAPGVLVDGPTVEFVSIPAEALDKVLQEMREAGTAAVSKAKEIRKKAKPSYQDNLHRSFLEGTSKTAAYFLEALDRIVEDKD